MPVVQNSMFRDHGHNVYDWRDLVYSASMQRFHSNKTFLAILFAGALTFISQALLQSILAVPFGTGPSLTSVVVIVSLLGGALGAQIRKIPLWTAPTMLGVLLLSPIPTIILHHKSIWPAIALVFFCALGCGFWVSNLLATVSPSKTTRLIGMEWLGGALGIAVFLLCLLPHFSITPMNHILGVLCLLGAMLSYGLTTASPTNERGTSTPIAKLAIGLSLWSGFQFFFAEITWSNLLAQVHTNSYMAFGIVLLSTLVAMPLAAILASKIAQLKFLALWAILANLTLPLLFQFFAPHLSASHAQQAFPWMLLLFSIAILAPVTIGSSLLFPYLLRSKLNQQATQHLYSANLLGGLLGACAAGYLSLPYCGLYTSLSIPVIGWGIFWVAASPRSARKVLLPVSIAAVACVFALWHWEPGFLAKSYQVRASNEDWEGRMEVVDREGFQFLLYNGSYSLGGSRSVASEQKQAELALSLRPNAHSAFAIGLGTGITAGRLQLGRSLQRIRIVELSPSAIKLSRQYFASWQQDLFANPHVQIEAGDARVALRQDTAHYDIILGDLFLPWLPGAELLMCKEHFQSVAEHLAPGGLFVQWLPLYQISEPMYQDILASILQVFPNVYLFRGNLDSREPMIALVAPKPGAALYAPGVAPEVLQDYAGNARHMSSLLAQATPWNVDNRIAQVMASGGLYAGVPNADQVMTGERYLNWIAQAFKSTPPEQEDAVKAFGPEAWRYAAQGFFLQQALYYQQRNDVALANEAMQRSVQFGPK